MQQWSSHGWEMGGRVGRPEWRHPSSAEVITMTGFHTQSEVFEACIWLRPLWRLEAGGMSQSLDLLGHLPGNVSTCSTYGAVIEVVCNPSICLTWTNFSVSIPVETLDWLIKWTRVKNEHLVLWLQLGFNMEELFLWAELLWGRLLW